MAKYKESTEEFTKKLKNDLDSNNEEMIKWYNRLYKRIISNTDSDITKLNILDIGCGCGHFLKHLKTKKLTLLYGLDVNPHSLKITKNKNITTKINMGDIYSLPYELCTFDIIILTEIIEHLEYPEKALKSIYDILKPGGLLLITTPNRMGLMHASRPSIKYIFRSIKRILGKAVCDRYHINEYFSFELSKLLKKQKFTVLEYPYVSVIPLFPLGAYWIISKKGNR